MGVYNTLLATVACPQCKRREPRLIQFKYGDSRMREFRIGQSVFWDVNVCGRPWSGVTLTSGIGSCEHCEDDSVDFVIELRGNELVAVWPRTRKDTTYWPDLDRNYAIHFEDHSLLEEPVGPRPSLKRSKWTTDDFHD
jgi:hypothetical protein